MLSSPQVTLTELDLKSSASMALSLVDKCAKIQNQSSQLDLLKSMVMVPYYSKRSVSSYYSFDDFLSLLLPCASSSLPPFHLCAVQKPRSDSTDIREILREPTDTDTKLFFPPNELEERED